MGDTLAEGGLWTIASSTMVVTQLVEGGRGGGGGGGATGGGGADGSGGGSRDCCSSLQCLRRRGADVSTNSGSEPDDSLSHSEHCLFSIKNFSFRKSKTFTNIEKRERKKLG